MSTLTCSFCGVLDLDLTGQERTVVRGPNNITICDECVGLCADIIVKDGLALMLTKQQAETLLVLLESQRVLLHPALDALYSVIKTDLSS